MMKKIFLLAFVLVLLSLTIFEAQFVEPLKATGEPPIEVWTDYTLDRDISFSGDGFIIKADNVVLNLNGHTINGSGGTYGTNTAGVIIPFSWDGIYAVTIKNGVIKNFEYGVKLEQCSECAITNITFTQNLYGVHQTWTFSSGNVIRNNTILNNTNGIELLGGDNNTISENIMANEVDNILIGGTGNNIVSDNIVTDGYGGINLGSGHNTLRNNFLANNRHNIASCTYWSWTGNPLHLFIQDIDTSNTVDGKPIYYLVNESNVVIDSFAFPEVGYLGLVNCKNITARNLNLAENFEGILLAYTNDSVLENLHLRNNLNGILLYNSSRNIITMNVVERTDYSGNGIVLTDSNFNTISGNMMLTLGTGVRIINSNNNTLYHNNIFGSLAWVDPYYEATNEWDNGYPSGGNYWSDRVYVNVDLHSGPNQDETGSDGISDIAYSINANNTDRFPLMGPIGFFNACIWDETTYYVHKVSNSTVSDFYFSRDDKLVSFNVNGTVDTVGFCRVTIPRELMWCDAPEEWNVTVNGNPPTHLKAMEDADYTYLYFTYNHSIQEVQIKGVHVIPEFPSFLILPLFMITTLLAVIIYRRKHSM